jgi:subtilisin-like proprotein convertase family protein
MGIKKHVALLASATLGLGLAALANPPANAAVFSLSNNTAITFANTGPVNAAPFPSNISQFGMSTVVTDVNVTLTNLSHTFPDDLDIELVGPNGTIVALMSDSCGGTDVVGQNFTFDDNAGPSLPDTTSCAAGGTFKPTNFSDAGPEQWLSAPTATTLAAFNGINPNGTWSIYAGDDASLDTGGIAGGWSIQITTAASAPITIPAFGASGGGVAAP